MGRVRGHPLTDEQRDAIADAIRRDPVPTHRAISQEFGVGLGTVYDIASEYGLADAWEHRREQSEQATATRAALVAEKRQRLEEAAIDAALEFIDKRQQGRQVAIKGMEGADIVHVEANSEDYRNVGQAVSNLGNTATQLAKLEAELSGAGQVSGLLEQFEQSLRDARERREQQQAAEGE